MTIWLCNMGAKFCTKLSTHIEGKIRRYENITCNSNVGYQEVSVLLEGRLRPVEEDDYEVTERCHGSHQKHHHAHEEADVTGEGFLCHCVYLRWLS